jgi:hypothetical protein
LLVDVSYKIPIFVSRRRRCPERFMSGLKKLQLGGAGFGGFDNMNFNVFDTRSPGLKIPPSQKE